MADARAAILLLCLTLGACATSSVVAPVTITPPSPSIDHSRHHALPRESHENNISHKAPRPGLGEMQKRLDTLDWQMNYLRGTLDAQRRSTPH